MSGESTNSTQDARNTENIEESVQENARRKNKKNRESLTAARSHLRAVVIIVCSVLIVLCTADMILLNYLIHYDSGFREITDSTLRAEETRMETEVRMQELNDENNDDVFEAMVGIAAYYFDKHGITDETVAQVDQELSQYGIFYVMNASTYDLQYEDADVTAYITEKSESAPEYSLTAEETLALLKDGVFKNDYEHYRSRRIRG